MKDAPAAMDLLLGGWQLGGIVNARTGVPIDVLITRPDLAYRDTRDGSIYANPVVVNGTVVTVPVVNTLGGHMTKYEALLDKTIARALDGLSSRAKAQGYDGVLGIRISHPFITSGAVEVVVSGTGFRFVGKPA